MNRTFVIQHLLNQRTDPLYLEIGIFGGANFLKIRARRKIGVDPVLGISLRKKLSALLKNPSNRFNCYHEITSDAYFASHSKELLKDKLDVVFIDGLHTYEQALRDAEQAITHLKDDGVIVMHDCLPPHVAASTPAASLEAARRLAVPGWDNKWCGDVWKAIVHLRSQRRDVSTCVLDCDMGLGIVRKRENVTPLPISTAHLASLTFADLQSHRQEWLGLRPATSVADLHDI